MGRDATRPEVWAGVECTVNRVGERFADQLVRTGHHDRPDDLLRLAALGVRTVRYPVLWERVEQHGWGWTDDRLARLRDLGVRPILGLVHHGSGPPHTSLDDPGFPAGLAEFAARVADRYPWADAYTPVNEPLTTARFSGLYGHWFPHGTTDQTFVRCLLHQCRAVALSMAAVRRVNPRAELVQTDDLGQTHAPLGLRRQARFENHRRWLSWDLLCGRVDARHPLRRWLVARAGASVADLDWFSAHPCPPDVVGVNYYATSERFLDDRLHLHPPAAVGGNRSRRYADVEAVRVLPAGPTGLADLLVQTWDRYRRPVAVTEAHLGCTREEQVRWLAGVWRAACQARARGADVRAVTAWAAFGAVGWDSLVTQDGGSYEPGLFDARHSPPRPTAVAGLVRELAAGAEPSHPVLSAPGWWERPERLLWKCEVPSAECKVPGPNSALGTRHSALPVLVAGGAGPLGQAFARVCAGRGVPCVALDRPALDVADPAAVADVLARYRPWAVVNAAGFGRVDAAERDPAGCHRQTVAGAALLAGACHAAGVRLLGVSSDLVFDGRTDRPYREADPVAPLGVYGTARAEAERQVLAVHPAAVVVRVGAVFGPWAGTDFVRRVLALLSAGEPAPAAADLTVSPAYLPDLCHAALDLLTDGERGVWHLAPPEAVTWADLARAAAVAAGLDPGRVVARPAAAFGWAARRPAFSALATARGIPLPPLADGLARFVAESGPRPAA